MYSYFTLKIELSITDMGMYKLILDYENDQGSASW